MKNKIRIAFNMVEFLTKGKRRYGICTFWLRQKAEYIFQNKQNSDQLKVPIFKRPSSTFRLPRDLVTPMIMIGPGTGVAPFIGFLQHQLEKKQSLNWLFYGCRNEKLDFIYQDEITKLQKEGILDKLSLAFSRDSEKKVYVQHRMLENAKEIVDLMVNKNAIIYVCGDAKGMAKGIFDTLSLMVAQEQGITKIEATRVITKWMQEKRYLLDVWS